MFNFSDKIKEFFEVLITDVMESTFKLIANLLFNPEGMTGFFQDVYTIFIGIGGMLLVCMILFKIIMGLLSSIHGESTQAQLAQMLTDVVKASAMIPILPFLLWVVLGKIIYPLAEFMFGKIGEYTAANVSDLLTSGSIGGLIGNNFMFIIIFGFIAVALFSFLIKMCIYHADILFLQLLSPLAAISIMADDNNYAGIWWREFLSQITTIILQIVAMVGVVEIISGANEFSWYQFMLLIGLCVLLIRGPSVTRNMWYATGAGKSMMGQGGKMASRVTMIKKLLT